MQDGEGLPLISAIVPARNEEDNIGACVGSLLEQGQGIEIIVAEDSSSDATAGIVSKIATAAGNVTLVTVPPLPPGWVGKNHAIHVGVQHATGEWLLFTDADTRLAKRVLRGVVDWAEKEKLDLVSFSPPQQMETWWERAVIPLVYGLLARLYPFVRVNSPTDKLAAANGQFILVRREAYRSIGGHEALRAEILEDVALARRAKQAGFRIWFGSGDGIVTTRMYRKFSAMWEGWTKNVFLLFGSNRSAVWKAATELALRGWLPPLLGLLLLLAGGPAKWAGIALVLFSVVEHLRYLRTLKTPDRTRIAALLVPGSFLLFLLLLNSERRYSRNRGVEWKGRRYPAVK